MLSILDPLRELSLWGVLLRIALSMLTASIIGYGRSQRDCAAGLRTYTLISLGATLATILTIYEYNMLTTLWAADVAIAGMKFDASRLAAQTITGIGFLGAGTIVKAKHQQVKGLTTATGLFATVCMGIAAGAGYYECVVLVMLIVVVVLNKMTPLEALFKRHLRNITLTVEMDGLEDIQTVRAAIEGEGATIYDINIESESAPVSAIFAFRASREHSSHSAMLSSVAELSCVQSVQELIS